MGALNTKGAFYRMYHFHPSIMHLIKDEDQHVTSNINLRKSAQTQYTLLFRTQTQNQKIAQRKVKLAFYRNL